MNKILLRIYAVIGVMMFVAWVAASMYITDVMMKP
jgi:hypothetical protein